jgi:hypothetical protein
VILERGVDGLWSVVMLPYTKFFNYGESLAAKLDWRQPVTVTEKSDGSLMTVYWYKGKWHVASQGKDPSV